jgi:hypothetical protein
MQNKAKAKLALKKSFNWDISSASISFMQTNELQAARDGSSSDGSNVSPLHQAKRKPPTITSGKA